MSAPISIIIPTLNAEQEISACLAALTPGISQHVIREVLVVDGGSTDKTLLPAFEAGARLIRSADKGRGRQLRTGGLNAKGDWLLFLHADTLLEASWAEETLHHIRRNSDKAACFTLAYRSANPKARWLESRANLRTKALGLPYGDQGLLISRRLYKAIGGYPDQPLMEDVEIMRRIGKQNLTQLSAHAYTSAAKYERDGWRRRAYSNALLLTRYFLGASPEKLADFYR